MIRESTKPEQHNTEILIDSRQGVIEVSATPSETIYFSELSFLLAIAVKQSKMNMFNKEELFDFYEDEAKEYGKMSQENLKKELLCRDAVICISDSANMITMEGENENIISLVLMGIALFSEIVTISRKEKSEELINTIIHGARRFYIDMKKNGTNKITTQR